MALLNENRNRVPQVADVPSISVANGIRGQMRMLEDEASTVLYVCTKSGPATPPATVTTGSMTFTANDNSLDGNLITVDVVGGALTTTPVITVTSPAITVTVDVTAVTGTTEAAIVAAINANEAAAVLITATGGDATVATAATSTLVDAGVAVPAALASLTVADVTYTAVPSILEVEGNDISMEYKAGSGLTVVVLGHNIVVTFKTGVTTNSEVALAVVANADAAALVNVVDGGAAADAVSLAATNLAGGTSGSAVWGTIAVAV